MRWLLALLAVALVVPYVHAAVTLTEEYDPYSVIWYVGTSDPATEPNSAFESAFDVTSVMTDDSDATSRETSEVSIVSYTFWASTALTSNQTANTLVANDGLTYSKNIDGIGRTTVLDTDQPLSNDSYISFRVLTDNPGATVYLTNSDGSIVYGSFLPTASFASYEVHLSNINATGRSRFYIWATSGSGADNVVFDYIKVFSGGNQSTLVAKFDFGYIEGNTYTLRTRVIPEQDGGIGVFRYVDTDNIDSTDIDIPFYVVNGTTWIDVDVTSFARTENADGLSQLMFRVHTEAGRGNISEIRLVESVEQDFTFLAQGPSEVVRGGRVKNEWQLLSSLPGVSLTNLSCIFESFGLGNESTESLNASLLDVTYPTFPTTANTFGVWWVVNESVIPEGDNLQVKCDVTINGDIYFTDVTQFVYVNYDRTFLSYLEDIWSAVMSILGIVQGLDVGVSAQMALYGGQHYTGESTQVVARLTNAGQIVETGSTCNVTMYYPNMTAFVDNQAMSYTGGGLYQYNVTLPYVDGTYIMDGSCQGGNLSATTFGSASWTVLDGVRMESIT